MSQLLQENKVIIVAILVVGVAGAVFAVTQTDIVSSVTGPSEDHHGDAMQAQGDAMEAESDAMNGKDDAMENSRDAMEADRPLNESMEQ